MTREELLSLGARLLVIGGASLAFAWWQQSMAAGLAFGLALWGLVVMRPRGEP